MAKLYNLARMTTATTGTGTITLGSAVTGWLSFAATGASDGDQISYAINDPGTSPTASEIGTGTYTASGTTLTRTVTKSTNSNSAINLSGNAHVFITPRAEDMVINVSAPAFSANLNSVNQTGIASATATLVNFNNTVYNVGSYFDTTNKKWTPPAGTIILAAGLLVQGTFPTTNAVSVEFYKNGALLYQFIAGASTAANQSTMYGSIQDRANGSDYYQIYVYQTTTSGTITVYSGTGFTFFQGVWICP